MMKDDPKDPKIRDRGAHKKIPEDSTKDRRAHEDASEGRRARINIPEENSAKNKEARKKVPVKQRWRVLFWALGLAGWVFISVVGSSFLFSLILAYILPRNLLASPVMNSVFSAISYLLSLLLVIFVPYLLFKKKGAKLSREELGLRGLPTWTDIGLAPIGYIIYILASAGLTAVFQQFSWFNAEEAQDLGYSLYMVGWERGLAFILLCIVAPVAEELIFRGWLYGKLCVKIPKIWAFFTVSLLFGLVHLQWNVGVSVFCMSVIMCVLREVTGSIYAGMLLHILNNSIAFYLVYVAGF